MYGPDDFPPIFDDDDNIVMPTPDPFTMVLSIFAIAGLICYLGYAIFS
jgi:hypothetical protein